MDTHQLGVVALVLARRGDAAAFLAALASGHPERFGGLSSWATPTFEVTSDAPIEMGLDGETMVMDSPLRFSIRPSPVRVRLPKHAIGYSPAARSLGWRKSLRRLWATALGTIPAVSDAPDRGSRLSPAERLAEVMEAHRDAPAIGRRQGTARARSGRPCRLPSDRRHTDAHARRAAASPLRTREPLEAVDRSRGGAVRARGTQRAKGSGDRARRGGHQLGRREPADEAGEQTRAPGPRRGGCAGGAPRTDADLHVVPVGPLGVGVRVRRGRGWVDAGARRTVARSGRGGRLLARAHGRALPGRRHRRVGRRGDDRRGDRARGACPAPTSRPRPSGSGYRLPLVSSRSRLSMASIASSIVS